MAADRAQLLSDDELLGALAASFPLDPVEPDATQLLQLSMAVATLRESTTTTPAHSPTAERKPHWSLPRRFSPVVIAGAAIGVLGAGTGISYAVGVPIPAAVRAVARTVGLAKPPTPTTPPAAAAPSPTVAAAAARQAESTLHQALAQSNPPPAVISHDSAVLAHRLLQVGAHRGAGAAGTTANGQQLLNEACRQLDGSAQATTGSSTSHTGTGGATFPGCGPVGVWHYPSGATNPSSTVPSATTGTTQLPSSTHSGAGTGTGTTGAPFQAPVGGSTGTSSGGTRTRGSTGNSPGQSPGHETGGSSGDRPGHGGSTAPPAGTQNDGGTNTNSHTNTGPGATDPRFGATSG
jgi:hypothetical protein